MIGRLSPGLAYVENGFLGGVQVAGCGLRGAWAGALFPVFSWFLFCGCLCLSLFLLLFLRKGNKGGRGQAGETKGTECYEDWACMLRIGERANWVQPQLQRPFPEFPVLLMSLLSSSRVPVSSIRSTSTTSGRPTPSLCRLQIPQGPNYYPRCASE